MSALIWSACVVGIPWGKPGYPLVKGSVFDDFCGHQARCTDRKNLVNVAVKNEGGHVYLLEVLG
jgi:hypothetical protein